MASITTNADVQLRPFPYLDGKWLRADLQSALRSPEILSILWNNLIKDNELYCDNSSNCNLSGATNAFKLEAINAAGNVSYGIPSSRRYYCGAEKLSCSCCSGYCRPDANCCNCASCRELDGAETSKKATEDSEENEMLPASDSILDSWLWCQVPSKLFNLVYYFLSILDRIFLTFWFLGEKEKRLCIKSLLTEQRDLSLQAAGHSLSAIHLKQRIFIYHRYLVALNRSQKSMLHSKITSMSLRKQAMQSEHLKKLELEVRTKVVTDNSL